MRLSWEALAVARQGIRAAIEEVDHAMVYINKINEFLTEQQKIIEAQKKIIRTLIEENNSLKRALST